jgi:hypothetical protein
MHHLIQKHSRGRRMGVKHPRRRAAREGLLPESSGQNSALNVLYVPSAVGERVVREGKVKGPSGELLDDGE